MDLKKVRTDEERVRKVEESSRLDMEKVRKHAESVRMDLKKVRELINKLEVKKK